MKIPRGNSLLFPYFSLSLFYFSFPFFFLFPLLIFFPDSCTGRIKHALRDLRTRIATALRGVPGANVAYAESCTRDTRAQRAQREKRNEPSRLARELMRRRVQCGERLGPRVASSSGRRSSTSAPPSSPPLIVEF